jgi:hypothetical protein
MTAPLTQKWTIRDGQWVRIPFVRTAKGDRPASDIEMGKKAR